MPYLKIDWSPVATLAICDKCKGWREVCTTPANAWKVLAIHAKQVHRDRHAVAAAKHAQWWHNSQNSRKRHNRKETN